MKILNVNKEQNKILDNQDKELYKLHNNVKKILYLSKEIYNEVEQQNVLVDRLDNKIETTTVNINSTEKKTNKIVLEQEKCICKIV